MPSPGQFSDPSIPAAPEDFARQRRRRWIVGIGAFALLVLGAVWMYKLQSAPYEAREAFDAGERSFRNTRYSQALISFERAIGAQPEYADAWLMRGRTNVALGRPLAAIPDFNKVIELRPRDPEPLLDRGSVHLSVHAYDDALADFERAVELAPRLDAAYHWRGTALRTLGQHEQALADFERAVELRPIASNLFQRGATYQDLGRHELAIQDFTRVIEIDQNAPQSYLARARSLAALGRDREAEHDRETVRNLEGR